MVAAAGMALVLAVPGVALAAPGDLDPSFDTDGRVTTDFGGFDTAQAVAVQADGKIITAGRTFPSGGSNDFALARYNTDGSLDTTFNGDGRVTTDFGGDEVAEGVAVQTDGKIVAAGRTGGVVDFALVRYNTDGSLDTTFNGDGRVTTDFGGDEVAVAVAVQADGSIVAAGGSTVGSNDFALARYNRDGSLDTTFDTDGKVTTDVGGNDQLWDAALQADGKIVAVGNVFAGPGGSDLALVRYNTDGSLDTTFDTDGKVTTDFAGGSEQAKTVALQADGKIVAAGDSSTGSDLDFALARYNTDGSLDTTFNGDGKVTTDFNGSSDQAFGLAVQADGKIVAAGSASMIPGQDMGLARYEGGGGDAEVSVTKAGPATASLGDQASYTVTVTNNSATVPASNVMLQDTVTGPGQLASATPSQGTCTTTATSANCALGALAPGASATVTVTIEPTATGTLTDTATVSATEPDPTPANNTASATTTVNNAHGCTIIGTPNADSLAGTNGNDVICGLGGNDNISAGNGNDTVFGGSGNDTLNGGNGDDTVFGGSGNDTVNGGNGTDALTGGSGNDTLNGGNGTDTCAADPSETVTSCP